jgi:hypothetical protein
MAQMRLRATGRALIETWRNGDQITVSASTYYVKVLSDTSLELYSDATLVTATNFTGTTGVQTTTVTQVVLDWRNGELTNLIEFDNDEPPILDGLMLFNNVPFGWQGNILYPSKIGNPESFPRACMLGQLRPGRHCVRAGGRRKDIPADD